MRQLAFYTVLTLVLAALIHVAAIVMLPSLASESAWRRLVRLGPPNKIIQLPAATPKHEVLPLMAPDIRYAFCRFDLSKGPIRIHTPVLNDLWLIALYTPDGQNFFTVSGADTHRPNLALIIATKDQNVPEAGVDAPDNANRVAVVRSPVTTGIALIRAPLPGPSLAARARAALKQSTCRLDRH